MHTLKTRFESLDGRHIVVDCRVSALTGNEGEPIQCVKMLGIDAGFIARKIDGVLTVPGLLPEVFEFIEDAPVHAVASVSCKFKEIGANESPFSKHFKSLQAFKDYVDIYGMSHAFEEDIIVQHKRGNAEAFGPLQFASRFKGFK